MTFLVVAENGDFATRVQEALEDRRHGCLTARDIEEAALTVQLARVDAMVLDLGTGEERALRWLAELSLARDLLASRCLLLASPPVDDRVRMQAAACHARVLEKPVEIRALSDALVECVRGRTREERRANGGSGPRAPLDPADPEQ